MKVLEYFEDTWLKKYPPSLWAKDDTNEQETRFRTNNALERYNRRLGEKFMNAHPNIYSFIEAIRQEEHYYSNYTNSIRAGIIPLPEQPKEFEY